MKPIDHSVAWDTAAAQLRHSASIAKRDGEDQKEIMLLEFSVFAGAVATGYRELAIAGSTQEAALQNLEAAVSPQPVSD